MFPHKGRSGQDGIDGAALVNPHFEIGPFKDFCQTFETSTYVYDEVGNLVSQTDTQGRITLMEHDALGQLAKRTRPLGLAETFAYDPNGNRVTHTDFNSNTTTFAYDSDDRLTEKMSWRSTSGPSLSLTTCPCQPTTL